MIFAMVNSWMLMVNHPLSITMVGPWSVHGHCLSLQGLRASVLQKQRSYEKLLAQAAAYREALATGDATLAPMEAALRVARRRPGVQ